MKKVISLALVAGAVASSNAALLYSSTIETGSRFNPQNVNQIIFDDINVPHALMAGQTGFKLNRVSVGIRRITGAGAVNVNVYAGVMGSTGLLQGAPILLQSFALAAATASATTVLSTGPLTNFIAGREQFAGFTSMMIGVQFSTTDINNGWRLTTGPGANANYFNLIDTVANTSQNLFFGAPPAPAATFYAVLDADPVPEPGSAIALVAGLGALVLRRKKA